MCVSRWQIALPLQREAAPAGGGGGCLRVRGRWLTHTATGRVTMAEPSLQTVPRDFTPAVSLRSAFLAPHGLCGAWGRWHQNCSNLEYNILYYMYSVVLVC